MIEPKPGNEIRETAFRALHAFSRWLDSDPEVIESMSPQELEEEMREMGLDPDRPIPHLPGRAPETPSIDGRLRVDAFRIALDTAGDAASPPGRSQVRNSTDIAAQTVQSDRTRLLIARGPDGECTREAIGSLLNNDAFRKCLRTICARFNFNRFAGCYSAEDLYQDTCLKVWNYRSKLAKPGNILSEQDFRGWLFVVTRNQYCNRVRQLNRLQARGCSRHDIPIDEIDLTAPEHSQEGKYLLNRFLDFIAGYSESRQWTIRLWLQGYSYREIATKLTSLDERCSHVTVANWIAKAIDAFRRTLEAYDTEPARSRAVAARLLLGERED